MSSTDSPMFWIWSEKMCSVPRRSCPSGIITVMSWKATAHQLHARAMWLRMGVGWLGHTENEHCCCYSVQRLDQSLGLTTRKHFEWQLFARPKHKTDTDQRLLVELLHEQSLLFILAIPTAAPTLSPLTFPSLSISLHTARHLLCYYDFCTSETFLWFGFSSYQ